jgi:hypothetical protein
MCRYGEPIERRGASEEPAEEESVPRGFAQLQRFQEAKQAPPQQRFQEAKQAPPQQRFLRARRDSPGHPMEEPLHRRKPS